MYKRRADRFSTRALLATAWTAVAAVEPVVMHDWVIRNLKLSGQIVVEYRKVLDRARDGERHGDGAEPAGSDRPSAPSSTRQRP